MLVPRDMKEQVLLLPLILFVSMISTAHAGEEIDLFCIGETHGAQATASYPVFYSGAYFEKHTAFHYLYGQRRILPEGWPSETANLGRLQLVAESATDMQLSTNSKESSVVIQLTKVTQSDFWPGTVTELMKGKGSTRKSWTWKVTCKITQVQQPS